MIKLANLNLVEKRLLLTFSVELSFNEKFEIQKKTDWRILIFADERDYNRIFHQDQRTLEYPATVWNVFKAFSAFSYKQVWGRRVFFMYFVFYCLEGLLRWLGPNYSFQKLVNLLNKRFLSGFSSSFFSTNHLILKSWKLKQIVAI